MYACYIQIWFGLMVFNATFNNISVILWWSALLVEETGVPGRKPLTCHKSLTNIITFIYITTDSIKPEKPPLDFHIPP